MSSYILSYPSLDLPGAANETMKIGRLSRRDDGRASSLFILPPPYNRHHPPPAGSTTHHLITHAAHDPPCPAPTQLRLRLIRPPAARRRPSRPTPASSSSAHPETSRRRSTCTGLSSDDRAVVPTYPDLGRYRTMTDPSPSPPGRSPRCLDCTTMASCLKGSRSLATRGRRWTKR
jgi:hypothetical protein